MSRIIQDEERLFSDGNTIVKINNTTEAPKNRNKSGIKSADLAGKSLERFPQN